MNEPTYIDPPELPCTEKGNWKRRFVCGHSGESRVGGEKEEGKKAGCLLHHLPALFPWFELLEEEGPSGKGRGSRLQVCKM